MVLKDTPFPALVRRGCPRVARAGAARSVSPLGRNINNCSTSARSALLTDGREAHRFIRSASRVFEQTTPALRAFPSLLRRGMGFSPRVQLGNTPQNPQR